ncbi:MAG: hypothetical protein RL308_894 [Bacteroidota bacterium]|jgi:hypothetical protein
MSKGKIVKARTNNTMQIQSNFLITQISLLLFFFIGISITQAQEMRDPFREPNSREYGGKAPERPEPGGGRDRDVRDRGNNPSGSRTSNSNAGPIERKTTVVINGEEFTVSRDTEKRLTDFINTYKTNGNVGEFVATVASVFSAFGLFDLTSSIPTADAVLKLATFGSEEVLTRLSAPSIWNRAWRGQAASFCESEWFTALNQGKTKDAQMWLRLRDIIANPERYKNGGMKYNHQEKKLMLRSYPAEAYRNIAGFDIELTDMDINQLGFLTNYLMYFPQSRDYIIYADYIYDLGKPKNKFKKITARDKMFLNLALLGLNQASKNFLENAFITNSINPNQSYRFWSALKTYLYVDKWDNGGAPDSEIDFLGFPKYELPYNSDLVSGQYPTTSIFVNNLPVNWNISVTERQESYKLYYPNK